MRRWKLFILIVIGMIIIGGAVLAIRSGKLILPVLPRPPGLVYRNLLNPSSRGEQSCL